MTGLVWLNLTGLLLVVVGTSAVTVLAGRTRARYWRRRANRAEEALGRLRAQRRQRREVTEPLIVPPGLFPAADRALAAEARTVLMRAETATTRRLFDTMGRRTG